MTPNRRIFLNIAATYGRSLYALVCGLFISRWVLAALGKTDFGVSGVVGGMMVIELLAGAMRLDRGGIVAGEMRGEKMANVITYGTFDLFHVGHLRLLQRARSVVRKELLYHGV